MKVEGGREPTTVNAYVIQTSSLVQGIMVVEEGRIQRQIIYILSDYKYTYNHHDGSQLHNKSFSSKQIVHTYIHTIGTVIPQCKNIILMYSLTFAILCSSNHLPVHDLVSAATFGRSKMICLVVQLLLLLTCSSFL